VSAVSLVRRIAPPGFALLVLCGCASHERPVSAPKMSQPRAARELRVMTFNLRVRTILDGPNIWDRRCELVVQRVRAKGKSVVCENLNTRHTHQKQAPAFAN
jgi:hypothetical protein